MIYIKLFYTFFIIGLFTFGGGYAALPLIERYTVTLTGWLSASEFTDAITVSQIAPGSVALNAASFIGAKLGGVLGAVAASLGCVAPSFIIVIILALLYEKFNKNLIYKGIMNGLRPAVVGIIFAAAYSVLRLSLTSNIPVSAVLFGVSLILLRAKKIPPLAIILICGAAGFICYSVI